LRTLFATGVSVALAAAALVGVHGAASADVVPPPGYFRIISKATYDCLTAQDNSPNNRIPMRMHGCDDVSSQYWRWGKWPRENPNALVNLHSQRCLSPNGGIVRDVQYVEQFDCLPNADYQRWEFFDDNGSTMLRLYDTDFALSIHSPINAHGARAMLYHFPGHRSSDQYWRTFCEPGTADCTPIGTP
jgi:hypothetical protein